MCLWIKIFKHLVRLSQIAEELQDENPEVSEKLTNFIDETADDIAPGADSPEVDQDMFPPIETPNIDEDVIEDFKFDFTTFDNFQFYLIYYGKN